MDNTIESACSFIGAMLGLSWAVVGAYVWLRYGFSGVCVIWSQRRELDTLVRTEFERREGR